MSEVAGNRDRVLEEWDSDGYHGAYIMYKARGVRFFALKNVVSAMYLFQPEAPDSETAGLASGTSPRSVATQGETADATIAPYSDVRVLLGPNDLLPLGASVSTPIDLELMRTLWFDDSTAFPEESKPLSLTVLEEGRNPGLGVRALHDEGIVGRDVLVGIIDQNLPGTDHPEYVGKVVKYRNFGTNTTPTEGSMHGPAVLSLLVGERSGTAPGARCYYAAVPSWKQDARYYAEALDWMIQENA